MIDGYGKPIFFIIVVNPHHPIIDESTDVDRFTIQDTVQDMAMILVETGEVFDRK